MLTVLVLAAGQGKRMVSDVPKIMHSLGGKAIIHHVIDVISSLKPDETIVIVSPTLDSVPVHGFPHSVKTVVQSVPRGTGDAVRCGLDKLTTLSSSVMIVYGDTPLLEAHHLQTVLNRHTERVQPCLTIVGMRPDDTGSYGRIVARSSGEIDKIVEHRDASDKEQAISLCNSGIMIGDGDILARLITLLAPKNNANEYYLTDVAELAKKEDIPVWLAELPAQGLQGINNRLDLAAAEKILQNRWRAQFMEQGVTLVNPDSVFFSYDTRIGRDVTISPNVTFGSGVTLGNRVKILPNCHVEKSTIGNDAVIGPFAHLREGTHLENGVTVGNFVEIKGSTLGSGTKAKHLSYLGNATIGRNVNIGAGTITCNHDGFVKSATLIHDNAFVGSNSCLVAPVTVGEGSLVAAGSVVTTDIPAGALGIGRSRQENKLSWVAKFRARHRKT
jgi:bifunctional UDP-N-acetylglucosamine pyrophosphorylase/glucosamine-1-phosphate N-acetyltransferase